MVEFAVSQTKPCVVFERSHTLVVDQYQIKILLLRLFKPVDGLVLPSQPDFSVLLRLADASDRLLPDGPTILMIQNQIFVQVGSLILDALVQRLVQYLSEENVEFAQSMLQGLFGHCRPQLLLPALIDNDRSDGFGEALPQNGEFARSDKLSQELFLALVDFVDPKGGDVQEVGVGAASELLLVGVLLFFGEEVAVLLTDCSSSLSDLLG